MRVIIDIEIETPDYDGKLFFREFNNLVNNIRQETGDNEKSLKVIKFYMRDKYGTIDERDFQYKEGIIYG